LHFIFLKWGTKGFFKSWAYYSYQDKKIIIGDYDQAKSIYSLWNNEHIGHINSTYSRESIEAAVAGTPFQYSTWQSYDYQDMTEFFGLYSKYPCIEYLTKLGMGNLVTGKLRGEPTYGVIHWRGKDLFQVLKISKQELHEIKRLKKRVTFYFLKIVQTSKKEKWGLTLLEIQDFEKSFQECYFDDLLNLASFSSMKDVLNYINRQLSISEGTKYSYKSSVVMDWRDYIRECIELGKNLKRHSILFPKNLRQAHKKTKELLDIRADAITDRKIIDKAKILKKQFYFEFKGLFIRPAADFDELILEGKELQHCAADYAKRYGKGETNIFFIRRLNEPEKPFYTVELMNNLVRQVRGFDNCDPDDTVKEFMEAFKKEKLGSTTSKEKVKKPA
jgi:hypothetical protein